MKILILSILVISLTPTLCKAENLFEQYLGCYQTQSINDLPVQNVDPLQTEIGKDASPYLDATTLSPMPAIKLFIYLGRFKDGHHMQLSYLPFERGTALKDELGVHYYFHDKIRFTTKPEKEFTLTIRIDFKNVSKTQLEVTIFNQFDEIGTGLTTKILLENSTCS
jgi:hypothetical protein